jgi:hypothetical protein
VVDRRSETRILPLARERGIAVIVKPAVPRRRVAEIGCSG